MKKQKFHRGDLVRIARDLGPFMSHFINDCKAIVLYSYNDKYGGGDTQDYCLYIKGEGETAWYEEEQLTLIKKEQVKLLEQWEAEAEAEYKLKSDLDWIFSHGEEVIECPHSASVQALASCFGLNNLWGAHGEGITFYYNSMMTLEIATPFLKTNNKTGWLKFSQELKLKNA